MTHYKVETLIYYTKPFANRNHLMEASRKGIQEKLDQYAADRWKLVSTDATQFGAAMYIYLYFEK
ncbi:hypothetical protein SAMN06265375_1011508 [Muriicola jejuensis]|uniref:DUF4177 domain-containing protein n=1 Tax=Muriicola jejuensis TaxID=504488 RepID=A0A6P0U6V8_9FLAO|nr:DUF4177 domain-containing protein [Muriicola jejuensis]NER09011.1 DUF4177 domain-containing protein [Muriicola jejuensis]SMP12147.1 hypothetical protein SAMN06265375_1011508 [Muriicola jejuensis]